jgi:hypothetical protein
MLGPKHNSGNRSPGRPSRQRGQHWLASRLGIAQSTISDLVRKGVLPRKDQYDEADVDDAQKKIAPRRRGGRWG